MAQDFLGDLLVRIGADMSAFQAELQRIPALAQQAQDRVDQISARVQTISTPPQPPAPPVSTASVAAAQAVAQAAQQQAAATSAATSQAVTNSAAQQQALARTGTALGALTAQEQVYIEDLRRRIDLQQRLADNAERATERAVIRQRAIQTDIGAGPATLTQQRALDATTKQIERERATQDLRLGNRSRIENQISEVVKGAGDREIAEGERVALAAERNARRFQLGALRGAIRETLPQVGIPVPFFGGPAFIAGSVAVGVAAAAIKGLTERITQLIPEMQALQRASDSDLESVARLSVASRQFGVDNATLAAGLTNLRQGALTNSSALQSLGIDAFDATGRARPMAGVFEQVRTALSRVQDPARQAALATAIFGSAAEDLLPLLRAEQSELDKASASNVEHAKSLAAATLEAQKIAQAADKAKGAWQSFTDGLGQNVARLLGGLVTVTEESDAAAAAISKAQAAGATQEQQLAAAAAAVAELRGRGQADLERRQNPLAAVEPPTAATAALAKLSAETQAFERASASAFNTASGGASTFGDSVERARNRVQDLAAQGIRGSLAGLQQQFEQLSSAGILGGQTERIIGIGLRLQLNESELTRVFQLAEGIADAGAAGIADVINKRLQSALSTGLEQQILAPLQAIEDRARSLQDQLAGIGESRTDRLERAQDQATDAAEARAGRLQRLADEEADHEDRLAERRDAATRALGDFHKAELDAALRAREEERAFTAFRPDATAANARDEERFQRNRTRALAEEARIEAREARDAARRVAEDARADARAAAEEKRAKDQLDAIRDANPQLDAQIAAAKAGIAELKVIEAEAEARRQATLAARKIETDREDRIRAERANRGRAPQTFDINLRITSPDGSATGLDEGRVARIVAQVLAEEAKAALEIVRGGGGGGLLTP